MGNHHDPRDDYQLDHATPNERAIKEHNLSDVLDLTLQLRTAVESARYSTQCILESLHNENSARKSAGAGESPLPRPSGIEGLYGVLEDMRDNLRPLQDQLNRIQSLTAM